MRCFKVVKKVGLYCGGEGQLVSLHAKGNALVDYEVGKLTTAPKWLAEKGHGVIAYDTLRRAASNAGGGTRVVLECAVMGPQRELPQFCSLDGLRSGQYRPRSYNSWPEGSVMYDGLIPMRVVPDSEIRAALGKKMY